jgi:peptidyl-prolyl cis-trans isomerase A (cyclophilin A)
MKTESCTRISFAPCIAGGTATLALLASPAAGQVLPATVTLDAPAPDSFDITFETTKGTVVLRGHRDWSPLGAARLYHLALAGYYDGAMFYRVGPTASYPGGRVIQFGLANDAASNIAWQATGLADEPVREPHRRGTVGFARDGANSRTVELAIDLAPNSGLDTVSYNGVVGFPPVAEVIEGLPALDRLHGAHGNAPMEDYDSIMASGRAFLDRRYPGLDRVVTARVTRAWW